MNRAKAIGTAAEAAVVRVVLAAGLPAVRVALAGSQDRGDVWVCGGRAVIEVKGGEAAMAASESRVRGWFAETQLEAGRVTACDLGVLVVKRRGVGVGRAALWDAYVDLADLWALTGCEHPAWSRMIRVALGDLIGDLVEMGWC